MSEPLRPSPFFDPDLSLARARGPRNFDGNGQRLVTVWLFAYIDRLEAGDFEQMIKDPSLDWVIMPLPGFV